MIASGFARTTVNRQAGRIKRMFRWGVAQKVNPAQIYHALQAVEGLRKGRSPAKETDPVLPVADEIVDATIGHLPEVVRDMVQFQRFTGCRPSEVCQLRPIDVDQRGEVWLYRPGEHKTEHRGVRVVHAASSSGTCCRSR